MKPYKRIFIVAAYTNALNNNSASLAGSKKIESVIHILSKFNNHKVILINSAHNSKEYNYCKVERVTVSNTKLISLTPFTLPNRKIGKLFNLGFAIWYAFIKRKKPGPTLIWCYNSYAFESLFSLFMARNSDIILEMEDMPFSRSRNDFGIKNTLDNLLLTPLSKVAKIITCVNTSIANSFSGVTAQKVLMPSLINNKLLTSKFSKPFKEKVSIIGYFGGLNEEKGADILIQLLEDLPPLWKVIITGSGALAEKFTQIMELMPDKLFFGHNVSEKELYDLMNSCDVLVNPHKSIKNMKDGVFPFKVYEYILTKRLVLSTELPKENLKIESALEFFDGSVDSLREKLLSAEEIYNKKYIAINEAADYISNNFSENGFSETIKNILAKNSL